MTIENWVEDESAMHNVGKNLLGDEGQGMAAATTQRTDYNPEVRGVPKKRKILGTRVTLLPFVASCGCAWRGLRK